MTAEERQQIRERWERKTKSVEQLAHPSHVGDDVLMILRDIPALLAESDRLEKERDSIRIRIRELEYGVPVAVEFARKIVQTTQWGTDAHECARHILVALEESSPTVKTAEKAICMNCDGTGFVEGVGRCAVCGGQGFETPSSPGGERE